nr:helix-turn-helix transcriptional regulator [Prauserella isguenensis]
MRSAIAASGLGLDRIQARLQDHGITISVTALSYWQSGKRQPERQSSISALRALEEILDVPAGTLLGLLPPPRPRGSTSRRRLEDRSARPLSLDDAPEVTLVGLYDHCMVATEPAAVTPGGDNHGRPAPDVVTTSTVTAKAIFRARADGQDRWLLAYRQDGAGGETGPPELTALRNCTVGRVEVDPAANLTLAELIFSRAIDTGETHLVEYSLSYRHNPRDDTRKAHFREFRDPIPEYLLEVDFDPACPPGQCWRYSYRSHGGTADSEDVMLDDQGRAHAVAVDFGPGVFGIGWL